MKRPDLCPNCGSLKKLWSHGCYTRGVSSQRGGFPVIINVKRYICRQCRRTTSLLPAFAQPYRLVRNGAIEDYFKYGVVDQSNLKWLGLLIRYKKVFEAKWPLIRKFRSGMTESEMSDSNVGSAWWQLEDWLGSVADATRSLSFCHRVTLFGCYRCHWPNGILMDPSSLHTTLIFVPGRDPPMWALSCQRP